MGRGKFHFFVSTAETRRRDAPTRLTLSCPPGQKRASSDLRRCCPLRFSRTRLVSRGFRVSILVGRSGMRMLAGLDLLRSRRRSVCKSLRAVMSVGRTGEDRDRWVFAPHRFTRFGRVARRRIRKKMKNIPPYLYI